MITWSLTLHGPFGVLSSVHTGEAQFVIGSQTAPDVFTVADEGMAARHVWVGISEEGLQVEDLAGGTLVNGNSVGGRVSADYPATISIGGVTIVIELKTEPVNEEFSPAPSEHREGNVQEEFDGGATVAFGMGGEDANTAQVFDTGTQYTKQEEIGKGGMARIVSAKDGHLDRLVAIKISTADTGSGKAQFLNEADVLARLAHPNIVPIYNRGTDERARPFYSMKLVRGRTLQEIITQLAAGDSGTLREYTTQRLLEIFRKVCDGVEFAHSRGYLHRDLKPENVMVGEFGEVLVMDWGLAKALQIHEPASLSYIEGSPQYMSPEQAEGIYGGLDERSDIYSLGAILYAILARSAPVSGGTLEEVIQKVRTGRITPFKDASSQGEACSTGDWGVPAALQAVTYKAMATERAKRYASVRAFITDIGAYQDGFMTSAEEASALRQIRLWVGRNRTLAVSALLLLLVIAASSARVVQKGREASAALRNLSETAPTFAIRTRDALEHGEFEAALTAATFAVKLQPNNGEYHGLRGNVLQVLTRWPEAVQAYETALRLGGAETARENLALTKALIAQARTEDAATAKAALLEALNAQGRQYEALAFGQGLGDFWKDRKKDLSAIPELVKRLEGKLLPVPGTKAAMSKTEFTVGEWRLYLRAEGLPPGNQTHPGDSPQTDEHPVVKVSWNEATKLCEWLSKVTGKEWDLPTNAEWEAAVGNLMYPWGDYFPPQWNDGNYSILEDGETDPQKEGVDGIRGTAPVGSFKSNALGFYDLGGNVAEWMGDEIDTKTGHRFLRGGSFLNSSRNCPVSSRASAPPNASQWNFGFRLVRRP